MPLIDSKKIDWVSRKAPNHKASTYPFGASTAEKMTDKGAILVDTPEDFH